MRFECPKCGQHYEVDDADLTPEVQCVKCNAVFAPVPRRVDPPEPPVPKSSPLRPVAPRPSPMPQPPTQQQFVPPPQQYAPPPIPPGCVLCPSCGGLVAKTAEMCPRCGARLREGQSGATNILLNTSFGCLFPFLIFAALVASSVTTSNALMAAGGFALFSLLIKLLVFKK